MSSLFGTSRQALVIIHQREVGTGIAHKTTTALRLEIDAARRAAKSFPVDRMHSATIGKLITLHELTGTAYPVSGDLFAR